jgi:O-6-methylguanine DNA methyltransferase
MVLARAEFDTPVGRMVALASDEALCALEFTSPHRVRRLSARMTRWFEGAVIVDGDNHPIECTRRWLNRYFTGEDANTAGLALDLRGAPFERRVWAALRDIPPGQTTTYGAIAKQVGSPGGARAVGLANGANPIAIVVPCHRVIGADGTLTGYGGGLDRKTWLIDHEARWHLPLSPRSPDRLRAMPAVPGRLPLDD